MAGEPVGDRNLRESQLFIDDTWVEDSVGVGRVFHSPKKYPTEGTDRHQPVAVRWQKGNGMAELKGRKVRLVFRMRDCHLYSFKAGTLE